LNSKKDVENTRYYKVKEPKTGIYLIKIQNSGTEDLTLSLARSS
jgi:hypothetical protein